jgi:hypothetical protein
MGGMTYHDSEVGHGTKKDTKSRPDLPAHDKPTSHTGRHNLGGEDWYSDFFQAHADTQKHTTDRELAPSLGQARTERCKEREDGGDEDGPLAANQVVDRVCSAG